MKVGYARVSTKQQNLNSQVDKLKKVGCERIFTDKISGIRETRPGLNEMMDFIRAGDEVVIFSLSRLGRSLKELLHIIEVFNKREINLTSLTENIETKTPMGRLVFHLFAALSAFERETIIERTKAGIQAARARGHYGGRPVKLSKMKISQMIALYGSRKYTIPEILDEFGISRTTFYNYLDKFDK